MITFPREPNALIRAVPGNPWSDLDHVRPWSVDLWIAWDTDAADSALGMQKAEPQSNINATIAWGLSDAGTRGRALD